MADRILGGSVAVLAAAFVVLVASCSIPSDGPPPSGTLRQVETTRPTIGSTLLEQGGIEPAPTVEIRNCEEAEAFGLAPIHRGEPGYRPALDRDGDGVACDQ